MLDFDIVKKVKRTNSLAYITYLLSAFSAAVGISVATKVQDAIVRPKLVKNN